MLQSHCRRGHRSGINLEFGEAGSLRASVEALLSERTEPSQALLCQKSADGALWQ